MNSRYGLPEKSTLKSLGNGFVSAPFGLNQLLKLGLNSPHAEV